MSQTVTMGEAAAILGVSPVKMWQLVKAGTIPVQTNPLDRRQRLVRMEDLERLKAVRERPRRPRSIGIVSDGTVQSDQVEDYLRSHWHPAEC
jgi:hypothetical protein